MYFRSAIGAGSGVSGSRSTGRIGRLVPTAAPTSHITQSDLSPRRSRQKARSDQIGGMAEFRRGDLLDRAFLIGIVLKGLDGVLEVAGGILLLLVSPGTIDRITGALTQHELSEDPHDFLANH